MIHLTPPEKNVIKPIVTWLPQLKSRQSGSIVVVSFILLELSDIRTGKENMEN